MARSRKKTLEPISLEELTNAPAMSGFVSFLNVKPWEQVEDTAESTGAHSGAPDIESTPLVPASGEVLTAPVETTPVAAVPAYTEPLPPPARPDISNTSPPVMQTGNDDTPPVTTGVDYVSMRRVRVHEVRVLQDALSFGEEALYNALWANAQPHSAEARRITIGFERMSRIARLTDKNCKLNCRALMEKRVVEEIADTNFRDGRTYLIYSLQAALVRQRESHLTHVVRTRGVVFVDPQSGRELTQKQHRRHRSTPVVSTRAEYYSTEGVTTILDRG